MPRTGNTPHNKLPICEKTMIQMYEERIPVSEIAKHFGTTQTTIYNRLQKYGITRTNAESHVGKNAREENPNWKGGRGKDSQGYVRVRINGKQVPEHRLVAEAMLGRPLLPGEVVHHKNGDRADNRPENLEVLPSQAEHMREHMTPDEARRRGANGIKARSRNAALKAVGEGVGA